MIQSSFGQVGPTRRSDDRLTAGHKISHFFLLWSSLTFKICSIEAPFRWEKYLDGENDADDLVPHDSTDNCGVVVSFQSKT